MEKQIENDSLNEIIKELNKKINDSADENSKMKKEMEKNKNEAEEQINQLEQYSRRNNLRIEGLTDSDRETAEETVKNIISKVNEHMPEVKISPEQIDIAHRIGPFKEGKSRSVIVKLQSRMTKQKIMKNKRKLKGTGIFINEDLTRRNQLVLASVRKKQADFITKAWSYEGKIFYKDVNDSIQEVKPANFRYWINMPWP